MVCTTFAELRREIISELKDEAQAKGLDLNQLDIPVAPVSTTTGYNVVDYFLGLKQPNAFAVHSSIGITMELYNLLTRNELKAVIAHELGHVYFQHTRKIIPLKTLMFTLPMLMDALAQLKTDSHTTRLAIRMLAALTSMSIHGVVSRSYEQQADQFAARLLKDRVSDLCSALDKIERHMDDQCQKDPVLSFLHRTSSCKLIATHPSTESRKSAILGNK